MFTYSELFGIQTPRKLSIAYIGIIHIIPTIWEMSHRTEEAVPVEIKKVPLDSIIWLQVKRATLFDNGTV